MSTRHLVDPEILPLLEALVLGEFTDENLPKIRTDSDARFAFLEAPVLTPGVRLAEGPDGPIEIYWYDPAPGSANRPALLHVHGGGMIIGSAESMQHGPAAIALATGFPVASVEYRLAPEYPFPAAQEDCLAGVAWLAGHADELGVNPERIGIMGESAGGGLAAAVALMARDRGGPALAAQFLTYPMLDHRTGGPDCPWRNATTGEFIWTRDSNRYGWESLRGSYAADDHRKGWFSPTLADDLAGLPPCWIGTGNLDLFLDENLDYARRLTDSGVPVELHVYPGAIHAFNAVADSRLGQTYARDLVEAIGRML
jgi:acetyl esterase/lipase